MMRRDLAFAILARHVRDEIIVPVYQAAQEWRALKPDHALTYYSIGAMGQASSAALGLALGRPDKRIIVLDGDGSLLMNLGSLVTMASQQPRNLVHFLCENGMYEANGGHPIPGRDTVSFAGLARAAGYPHVHEFTELAAFEAAIAAVLRQEGPVFATLKLVPGEPPPQDYTFIHGAPARATFRAALRRG
jgi:thiamine pyrophosphate-dependent acetolactate synthase large subunit-like protein